jgi:hypothetical protein
MAKVLLLFSLVSLNVLKKKKKKKKKLVEFYSQITLKFSKRGMTFIFIIEFDMNYF